MIPKAGDVLYHHRERHAAAIAQMEFVLLQISATIETARKYFANESH